MEKYRWKGCNGERCWLLAATSQQHARCFYAFTRVLLLFVLLLSFVKTRKGTAAAAAAVPAAECTWVTAKNACFNWQEEIVCWTVKRDNFELCC